MARQDQNSPQAIALREEPQRARLPMPKGEIATDSGITAPMWKLLTDTVYPSAKTVDGILQAVAYCTARNLDVMKRPVHVVPMWNSTLNREVETVWPGIGELRTTAARTGQWAGIDECVFGPTQHRPFKDKQTRRGQNGDYVKEESCEAFDWPLWAQVTVYRILGGQRVAFVGPKVLFTETFSGMGGLNVPNSMWRKRPFGQLGKCAEAAALRLAFPEEIGEQYAAEEMEGKTLIGHNGGPVLDEAAGGGGGAATPAPTRAQVQAEQAAAKREADEILVAATTADLARFQNLDHVIRLFRSDEARINQMDADLKSEILGYYAEAKVRLTAGKADHTADAGKMIDEDDHATDDGEDADWSDEDIVAYRDAFGKKLSSRELAMDVDSLLKVEAANLESLPAEVRSDLEKMATDRRMELSPASNKQGAAS